MRPPPPRCALPVMAKPDPYAGLIDPTYLATEIPDLDLDHPWALLPDDATELALRCDTAARDFSAQIDQIDDVSAVTTPRLTRLRYLRRFRRGLHRLPTQFELCRRRQGRWQDAARPLVHRRPVSRVR